MRIEANRSFFFHPSLTASLAFGRSDPGVLTLALAVDVVACRQSSAKQGRKPTRSRRTVRGGQLAFMHQHDVGAQIPDCASLLPRVHKTRPTP